MADPPPLKKLRSICEKVDTAKYKKEIAAARVRVLQRILANPNTPDQYKILCVGERMENFEGEDEILHKIEQKSQTSDWPTPGSPEETARLDEIASHWAEIVMMKSLIYDRVAS
jgi:hypothetical protein